MGAGVLLSGCQQVNQTEARAACGYVNSSIALLTRSEHDASPAAASNDRATALLQLRLALPQAALASTKNGGWDALVTTLSETSRVPESYLVPALTQQCSVFDTPGTQNTP